MKNERRKKLFLDHLLQNDFRIFRQNESVEEFIGNFPDRVLSFLLFQDLHFTFVPIGKAPKLVSGEFWK